LPPQHVAPPLAISLADAPSLRERLLEPHVQSAAPHLQRLPHVQSAAPHLQLFAAAAPDGRHLHVAAADDSIFASSPGCLKSVVCRLRIQACAPSAFFCSCVDVDGVTVAGTGGAEGMVARC
jgi:hypothetical protein